MSDKFRELENEIDNVMSDEQVDRVLEKLNEIEHEYQDTRPTNAPALNNIDNGTGAIVESALANGYIENVGQRRKADRTIVDVSIVLPERNGLVRNFNQNERR